MDSTRSNSSRQSSRQSSRLMTTVTHVWRSSRAVATMWVVIVALFAVSFVVMFPRLFVRYDAVIPPVESQLCPGDNLSYSVVVEIAHFPGVAKISENWCHAGVNGACSNTLAKTRDIPLAAYRKIAGSPSIPVPVSSFFNRPGPYEYWHVAVNGKADGYIVPFTIREDCPDTQPPTPTPAAGS